MPEGKKRPHYHYNGFRLSVAERMAVYTIVIDLHTPCDRVKGICISVSHPWLFRRLLRRANLNVVCIGRPHTCPPESSGLSVAYGSSATGVWAFGNVQWVCIHSWIASCLSDLLKRRHDENIIVPSKFLGFRYETMKVRTTTVRKYHHHSY